MDFLKQLSGAYWKNANDTTKQLLFEKLLTEYVSPDLEISQVSLVDFAQDGLKTRTFELIIGNEPFVFIPGQEEVILGWENGAQGLPNAEIWQDGESREEIDAYINTNTTHLRKTTISPMIVGMYAFPASTNYIGRLDAITGEFSGEVEKFTPYETEIREVLSPDLDFESSLTFVPPTKFFAENKYYIQYQADKEIYRIFLHENMTLEENLARINQWGFALLDEDEWEYMSAGGTRKLFRWGNTLRPTNEQLTSANMFGVFIESDGERFEITDEEEVLKLGQGIDHHNLIEETMFLSSYYQSFMRISKNEILSPMKYLYRKALIIQ